MLQVKTFQSNANAGPRQTSIITAVNAMQDQYTVIDTQFGSLASGDAGADQQQPALVQQRALENSDLLETIQGFATAANALPDGV